MDIASMVAINNLNMITMMNTLQEVNHVILIKLMIMERNMKI